MVTSMVNVVCIFLSALMCSNVDSVVVTVVIFVCCLSYDEESYDEVPAGRLVQNNGEPADDDESLRTSDC